MYCIWFNYFIADIKYFFRGFMKITSQLAFNLRIELTFDLIILKPWIILSA